MKIISKIHGKSYDLTNFKHPGGSIPLYLINGKDGTCLFESYHPVSNRKLLRKILDKYEIPEDKNNKINEQNIYNFHDFEKDNFVNELRMEVYDYFKNISKKNNCSLIEATKMNNFRKIEIFILFIFMIFSYKMYIMNTYIGKLLFPFSIYLFQINTYHDISHFAFLNNKIIEIFLSPFFYFPDNPLKWLNDHVNIHHSYPNIRRFDRKLFKNIECSKVNIPNNYNYYFKFTYYFFNVLFVYFIFCINGIISSILNFIFFNFVIILLFFIFERVNHKHIHNIKYNKNFYIQQIISSTNVKSNRIIYLLSGGLNYQIEHHLFPSVNSCHLKNISKIVSKLSKKYNIKYNEFSDIFTAFKNTLNN